MQIRDAKKIVRGQSAYPAARAIVEFGFVLVAGPFIILGVLICLGMFGIMLVPEQSALIEKAQGLVGWVMLLILVAWPILAAILIRSMVMAFFDMADAALSQFEVLSEVRDTASVP